MHRYGPGPGPPKAERGHTRDQEEETTRRHCHRRPSVQQECPQIKMCIAGDLLMPHDLMEMPMRPKREASRPLIGIVMLPEMVYQPLLQPLATAFGTTPDTSLQPPTPQRLQRPVPTRRSRGPGPYANRVDRHHVGLWRGLAAAGAECVGLGGCRGRSGLRCTVTTVRLLGLGAAAPWGGEGPAARPSAGGASGSGRGSGGAPRVGEGLRPGHWSSGGGRGRGRGAARGAAAAAAACGSACGLASGLSTRGDEAGAGGGGGGGAVGPEAGGGGGGQSGKEVGTGLSAGGRRLNAPPPPPPPPGALQGGLHRDQAQPAPPLRPYPQGHGLHTLPHRGGGRGGTPRGRIF